MKQTILLLLSILLLTAFSGVIAQNESYELHFDIQYNKSQFSDNQLGATDRDPFRPLEWLGNNGTVTATITNPAGGRFDKATPILYMELEEMMPKLNVYVIDARGSIVREESISMNIQSERTSLRQAVNTRQLGEIDRLALDVRINDTSIPGDMFNPAGNTFITNGVFYTQDRSVSSMAEVRRLASEIGRSAVSYVESRGIRNSVAIVVIAAPEKSAFNTPIYPGVAVFTKVK